MIRKEWALENEGCLYRSQMPQWIISKAFT
jgi:hypothetical protein